MGWEKTVMSKEQYGQVKHAGFVPYYHFALPYLEAQAERTFPLGEKQGITTSLKAYESTCKTLIRQARNKSYKAGMKEAGLQLRAGIGGIDEFIDWSDEGLRSFRKTTLEIVENLLKKWGIKEAK